MASTTPENKLECKSMLLKLHTLFDIPRDLVSLDSRRENVELVLKPTAKYYSENKRFCKLDLPEQHVAFSPSSIIFKGDRFVLDFYSAPQLCGLSTARSTANATNATAAATTAPQRASSFANGVPANSAELCPSHGLTNTATPGVASSTGRMKLPVEGDARGGAVGPRARAAFGADGDDDHDVNLQSPASPKLKPSTASPEAPAAAALSNEIMLRYPTRPDLKVIIEVMVGARQRRHDSSAVRWITPSWADRSIAGNISTFAAADGEVVRHKLVNRFVGLTVGHLSCTMELPYAADDLRDVCAFKPTAMYEAADRLSDDYERLHRFYTRASEEQLARLHERHPQRRAAFVERLQSGASEMSIYRELLLDVCPDYFTRRIRRICTMYPPTSQSSAWVRTDAERLAEDYAGREMELIRSLCAELGPDLSAISPRNRFLSYTNVQTLGEELWRLIQEGFANQENDILDYEPDVFMEALALQYETPEPTPIQYGFPAISYELDRRAYFCEWLRFPVNREHHRYRDEALAARQTRVPLQLTPCERPLHPIRPTSRNVGEIDILLEKYKPEFAQIVPSIADAMECVTQNNERLLQRLMREAQGAAGSSAAVGGTRERMRSLPYEVCPHGFQLFQSERATGSYVALLNRFAEYTYISPSTLLSAMIYLDRLCLRHPRLLLTSRNIEKLLVAAVRVASKVVDLRSVNNKNFANVFTLVIQDMNDLESEFLRLMDFDFFLSPKEFNNYVHLVQLPAAYQQMSSSLRLSSANLRPGSAGGDTYNDVARGGGGGGGVAGGMADSDTVLGAATDDSTNGSVVVRAAANGRPPNEGGQHGGGGGDGGHGAAATASTATTTSSDIATTTVRSGLPMQPTAPPPRGSSTVVNVYPDDAPSAAAAAAAAASVGGGAPPQRPPPSVVARSPTRAGFASRAAAAPPPPGTATTTTTTATSTNAVGTVEGGVAVFRSHPVPTNGVGGAAPAAGQAHPPNGYGASGGSGGAAMTQAEFASGARAVNIPYVSAAGPSS